MDKRKLNKARIKIDQIDNKIFNLIKKRTQIVKYMITLKKHKNQIVDYKRTSQILKKIKTKSIKNKIDTKVTAKIWKSIIWSYVDYQRRKFKKS